VEEISRSVKIRDREIAVNPALEDYWAQLCACDDEDIDLGIGALLVSSLENPHVEIQENLDELDHLAEDALIHLKGATTDEHRIQSLARFLAQDCAFTGNTDNYYDPQNSCLDAILEGQPGIPISLSVLFLEVARRIGIEMVGVAFPGHFFIKHKKTPDLFVDAFHEGEVMTYQEVRGFFHRTLSTKLPPTEAQIPVSTHRSILIRMLQNLKSIYQANAQPIKTISVIDRLLLLDPDQPREYLVRAINYMGISAHEFALQDLQTYVDISPKDSEYRAMIVEQIKDIRRKNIPVLH
jgi:regulator of sirC expression with transglutaminase-like and TPR domain